MDKQWRVLFILILFLTTMGQIVADIYLPSLPNLVRELQISDRSSQLTLTIFFLGFACSQLIYGPLSDTVGRRRPLLIGLGLCLLGSLLAWWTPNLAGLLLGRLLQGLGAGASVSLARAMLRDLFKGKTLARFSSLIAMGNVVLISMAPMMGGYLQHAFGWRSNFLFLTSYVGVILAVTWYLLPETHPVDQRIPLSAPKLRQNLWRLLKDIPFLTYSGCMMLAYGAILSWLTTGSILYANRYHMAALDFGILATAMALCFMFGSFVNGRLLRKQSVNKNIRLGFLGIFIGGASLFLLGFISNVPWPILSIFVAGVITALAFIFPNAFAAASESFPDIAGFAGAIFGFLQVMGGVITSSIIAVLPSHNTFAFATVLMICALLGLMILRNLKKHGEHTLS